MNREAIYKGTNTAFRNKCILVVKETRHYYRFEMFASQLSIHEQRKARQSGVYAQSGVYRSYVAKKNVQFKDIVPDNLFRM